MNVTEVNVTSPVTCQLFVNIFKTAWVTNAIFKWRRLEMYVLRSKQVLFRQCLILYFLFENSYQTSLKVLKSDVHNACVIRKFKRRVWPRPFTNLLSTEKKRPLTGRERRLLFCCLNSDSGERWSLLYSQNIKVLSVPVPEYFSIFYFFYKFDAISKLIWTDLLTPFYIWQNVENEWPFKRCFF